MDDTVPYEGYGDANNHSETLNKTLHHAMLVRTHTFTAHRTHQELLALQSTVMASGAPHLPVQRKQSPARPSLYCKPILRHQPILCAASLSSAPPAYPLHRQPILGGRFENCRSVPLPILSTHPSHTSQ